MNSFIDAAYGTRMVTSRVVFIVLPNNSLHITKPLISSMSQ